MFSRSAKRYVGLGIIFCLAALLFFLLYYFKAIKTLDIFPVSTYISYFVGIAFLYNGAFEREFNRIRSAKFNFICGLLFLVAAIVLLGIGLSNGKIVLFK